MAIMTRVRALGRRGVTSDVALFAGSLALYLKTLSPTVYTFDSAEHGLESALQMLGERNDLQTPYGQTLTPCPARGH